MVTDHLLKLDQLVLRPGLLVSNVSNTKNTLLEGVLFNIMIFGILSQCKNNQEFVKVKKDFNH